MSLVTSIEKIEPHNVLDTACKPFRVFCSDLDYYYCKYNAGFSVPYRLLREYLSASFLKIWNLPQPDFSFIKILKEHVSPELKIPYTRFDTTCFGTRKVENAIEVTSFLTELSPYQKTKFNNKSDYLKISLFDIWIANDDRNHNNYNLLVKAENGLYSFVAIDHERVFNTGNLDKPLYTITEESSLLTAPLCGRLFLARELTERSRIDNMHDDFYLCVKDCARQAAAIIRDIPPDWQINPEVLNELLHRHLLNKQWLVECWETFLQYLQLSVNKLESK